MKDQLKPNTMIKNRSHRPQSSKIALIYSDITHIFRKKVHNRQKFRPNLGEKIAWIAAEERLLAIAFDNLIEKGA
jgi:hypothetical protein